MGTRSSKSKNTNGGEDEEQQPEPQLGRSERKRKLNELANDGKLAGGKDQIQQEESSSSSKINRNEKNDPQDLEVCSLHICLIESENYRQ
jgi:hypothetical protein